MLPDEPMPQETDEWWLQQDQDEEWIQTYEQTLKENEMPLNVSDSGGGDFKQVEQGTHCAVCNMVVDLGLQETFYGVKQQVYIRWELPNERLEYEKDGVKHEGPMSIGSFYTASLSEKANLRRDLEGWRGRAFTEDELSGFDVFQVLGTHCQLNVKHNENGKARVYGVAAWPKGMEKKPAENPLLKYSPDEADSLEALPEWIQEIIGKQVSRNEISKAKPDYDKEPYDDDIPF